MCNVIKTTYYLCSEYVNLRNHKNFQAKLHGRLNNPIVPFNRFTPSIT